MGLRSELAAHLRTALGDGVNVYDHPADAVKAPAVIIAPGDPYLVPDTLGGLAGVKVVLDLHLVGKRARPQNTLTRLEELRKAVTDAFAAFVPGRVQWLSFGDLSTVDIGGVEYLTGVLQCGVRDVDR